MKIQMIKLNGQMLPLPEWQEDIDKLKTVRVKGEESEPIIYNVNITAEQRDGRKHRRLFALLNIAFQNQHESTTQFINPDHHREELLKKSGHCEQYLNFKNIWVYKAKSISYNAIDQIEADRVYENLVHIVLKFCLIGSKKSDIDQAVEVAMRF
jgi:hypothetical protein